MFSPYQTVSILVLGAHLKVLPRFGEVLRNAPSTVVQHTEAVISGRQLVFGRILEELSSGCVVDGVGNALQR